MEDYDEDYLKEAQKSIEEAFERSKQIMEEARKNNNIFWKEAVSYLKEKGLYSEFESNPILEAELKRDIDEGEHILIGVERVRERILVNYFIRNVDKEAEKFGSNDEKILFFISVIDDLCKQRIGSKKLNGKFISGVYDSVLEGKLTLMSIRYNKIVGPISD